MPEGDTIHRAARRLSPLVGGTLERVEVPRSTHPLPREGETVTAVEAIGKWLRIDFSGGRSIVSHMRMNGRWDLYAVGERWRRPRSSMRAVVTTGEWEAVCFAAPVVKVVPTADASLVYGHVGPDLTSEAPDLDAALAGFALLDGSVSIAEALLDQRVGAGIGNVYKSELCWFERLDPFTPVGQVPLEVRRALLTRAHRLLRVNLTTPRRTTVPGGLAVYNRTRKPCRRCGTLIRSEVHTMHARRTFWCPGCQVRPGEPGGSHGSPDDDQPMGK